MAYNPNHIKAAYDEIAEREDEFEKGFSLRNEIPKEFIRRYIQASDVVLDAGGGAGINAIMMARQCKRVTLLDISPKMLELAAANIHQAGLGKKIELIEGDLSNLEQFGNAQFSFVVCVGGVLSYVLEKGPWAIRELVRVAKPGSILIIGCDSKYGFVRWLLNQDQADLDQVMQVYAANEYEAGEEAYAHLYTVAELSGLLQAAGCQIAEMASTPTLVNSWDQSEYPKEKREPLKALELEVCTAPELLGVGHHLICVAKK